MKRSNDQDLLINKLQETLKEIAQNIDLSAINSFNIQSENNGVDMNSVINNVQPPADVAEEHAIEMPHEIIETEAAVMTALNDEKENIDNAHNEKIEDDDDDDVSSDAIRYNSKGESIENPNAMEVKKAECKVDKNVEVITEPPVIELNANLEELKADLLGESNESNGHGLRLWDEHGNSLQQEDSPEQQAEAPAKAEASKANGVRDRINSALNQKVGEMRDNQLAMRQMESDESGFKEDDDIPVITIPMGDNFKGFFKFLNYSQFRPNP